MVSRNLGEMEMRGRDMNKEKVRGGKLRKGIKVEDKGRKRGGGLKRDEVRGIRVR